MDMAEAFACMLVAGAITFGCRALPFIASGWLRRQEWVKVLGAFLPLAIMVILTVHSIWSGAAGRGAMPWAELSAIGLTCILQWFTKNALASIFAGSLLYCTILNGWLF